MKYPLSTESRQNKWIHSWRVVHSSAFIFFELQWLYYSGVAEHSLSQEWSAFDSDFSLKQNITWQHPHTCTYPSISNSYIKKRHSPSEIKLISQWYMRATSFTEMIALVQTVAYHHPKTWFLNKPINTLYIQYLYII